jgi:hypothetical protein
MPHKIQASAVLLSLVCSSAQAEEDIPYNLSPREQGIVRGGAFALFQDPIAVKKAGLVRFGPILAVTSAEFPESLTVCGVMKRGDFAWDVFTGTYAHAVRDLAARFDLNGADRYFGSDTRKFCEKRGILPPLP